MSGLPAWIGAALDRQLEHVSRADLSRRALAASETYRAGGSSSIIASELDALAYAVVRMPATYAAVRAALGYTRQLIPDFAPRALLDIGAGPGTATWAALDAWPSLERVTLIDRNRHLLNFAKSMHAAAGAPQATMGTAEADVARALAEAAPADVVMASYAFAELPEAAQRDVLARLWRLAERLLVVVEPGTVAGFRRVLAYRDALIDHGARIVAPCSHEGACPLANAERWCHFGVRLPRTRDHILTKGARVPYEDEKFIYLVAGKGFADIERGLRVLTTPKVSKAAVALTLCRPRVAEQRVVPRRAKDAYRDAKRADWGDALPE